MLVSGWLLAASASLRVASLDLCADEYLLLLARPNEIASVSRVAQDPADSVLWRQARRYPASIGEVEATMVRVATALGDARRADGWRGRLAQLEASPLPQRDTIFLSGGGNSLAAGSMGAQWMALGGFRQRALPGGRASLETLATKPPQILLRSTYRRSQLSLGQRWLDHPLVRRPPARMIDTDGRPWTCAGPLLVTEIERLRGLQ